MSVELICPYCQHITKREPSSFYLTTDRITCDDGVGAAGCGKIFYIEAEPIQWKIDYYTNIQGGL